MSKKSNAKQGHWWWFIKTKLVVTFCFQNKFSGVDLFPEKELKFPRIVVVNSMCTFVYKNLVSKTVPEKAYWMVTLYLNGKYH